MAWPKWVALLLSSLVTASRPYLIYVDPCSFERRLVLDACAERGIGCVQCWSPPYAAKLVEQGVLSQEDADAMCAPGTGEELEWWTEALSEDDDDEGGDPALMGVLCGSDAGLATAERLQDVLVPERSNGIDIARRDKYLQNEALRAAGLDSAQQCAPSSWSEAEAFLQNLPQPEQPEHPELLPATGIRAVLKPRRGQDSLRVGLATSVEQARSMFDALCAARVSLDEEVEAAPLLQEYLVGDEWVVDSVSRGGEHRVLALWRYEKEAANGAPFVYSYMELASVAGTVERSLTDYACAVLDALQWRWGPCHIELKATPRGPVLVEVNAGRFSGGDFKQLCDLCLATNAYEATLDAYDFDGGQRWASVPARPPKELSTHGRMMTLVSSVRGPLRALQHEEEIRALPSLVQFKPAYTEPGEHVELTFDLATVAGHVMLAHSDRTVLERDYARLRELQPTMYDVVAQ